MGIRTNQVSAPTLQALDFYFNQTSFEPDKNLQNEAFHYPTPSDFDASIFDAYLSDLEEAETGRDNLNQKITQNTLADYRRLTAEAKNVIEKARDLSTLVAGLSGDDLVELPIALRFVPIPDKPDFRITLVIAELMLYPQYTQMATYLMIEAAELGEDPLIFHSPNVKFSMKSGIIGDNVLGLMGEFPTRFYR
jgi:hypothetical protein